MKRIKLYWCVLVFLGWFAQGCHEVPVGYLITEYASYSEDTMVIKFELTDVDPGISQPNPQWEMMFNMGMNPDALLGMGIYPMITIGQGEDYLRDLYDIPWVSVPLEGLQGTPPIFGHVKSVVAVEGDGADVLKACITVRGDGTIEIPAKHGVSVGVYTVSLTFTNEGYSRVLDICMTVVVK